MKKLLILHILLSLCLIVKAQMYSTSPYLQEESGYGASSMQYNSVKQTTNGYSPNSRIGYTTKYSGVYKPSTALENEENIYNTGASTYNQPRRAKGGSSSNGVTVTYETTYISGLLHPTYLITYTYPDGHKETEYYQEWFGYFSVNQYAAQQAEKRASEWKPDPPQPYLDPIGEPYILLCLVFIYGIYTYRKKKTVSV